MQSKVIAIQSKEQCNQRWLQSCADSCKQRCGLPLQIATANGIANHHCNFNSQQQFAMSMDRDSHRLISNHGLSVLDVPRSNLVLLPGYIWNVTTKRHQIKQGMFFKQKTMAYSSASKIFDNNSQSLVFRRRDNAIVSFYYGVNACGFKKWSSDEIWKWWARMRY